MHIIALVPTAFPASFRFVNAFSEITILQFSQYLYNMISGAKDRKSGADLLVGGFLNLDPTKYMTIRCKNAQGERLVFYGI